jgi:hypothetical protein
MKQSTIVSAANQGALPPPNNLDAKPDGEGWVRRPQPEAPSQPPAIDPGGWSVLSDRERAYLSTMHGMKPAFAISFERRERDNILALTGMTREEFENREVPESLLAYLRRKSRWAAGSPFGYVRMLVTQTATQDGKNKVYQKGVKYGIGTDIDGEVATEFIGGQAAVALPTFTIRVLCSVWPGGLGVVIPASRLPKMKNTNGVEVQPYGTMLEPAEQHSRGELVLYTHELPLKASPDYLDHQIRHSLDFGTIQVICKGRLLDDPALLPACPLPEPKKAPEGNPRDRRAQQFREMKGGPVHGYDAKANYWYHIPA